VFSSIITKEKLKLKGNRGDIMPKLFVVSDVHSYYDEMKKALDDAGFDPKNENHWLISCGDALDRGPKSQEVVDYLMSLPRCILIKGNHDLLIMDCINRGYPQKYDHSNGTFRSVIDLAPYAKTFGEACMVAYEKVKPFIDRMVNYFETENYIFVHSFVPLKNLDGLPMHYTKNRKFAINPDWRHAHASDWEASMWGNPFELAEQGLLPDKTLVFGHWHTSWPRHKYEGKPEFGEGADFGIYYGDGYIGIDAMTALSNKVNVLIIDGEEFI
jgi:serine/threonine protein phosphatase 1